MGRLFGTDGVRGVANLELSCERAMEIGRASASVLSEGRHKRPLFLIGCDTRASSDMLVSALCAGLCSAGADVIDLGILPTPAVAYLIKKHGADAGLMVSASHNPAEYNGIKIFGDRGYKLPDMLEDRIEAMVLDGEWPQRLMSGVEVGRINKVTNASWDYTEYLKSTVPVSLEGLSIAIDCANGAASATAKNLFSELGATVSVINDLPDGRNINKSCGSTDLLGLSKFVTDNALDCGIAFDGDADRCLFVDEKGKEVDGDAIMAICALDLKKRGKLEKNTVVGTVMTNFGFGRFCESNGIRFVATKVGDRYVLEEMLLGGYVFGGEQSGHIIFSDLATTGDGQLTAIQLLAIMRRESIPLSSLASVMIRFPQTTVNLKVSDEGKILFYTDRAINEKIAEAKSLLDGSGRIVVRPSGTEPLIRIMVEGEDVDMIKRIADDVASTVKSRLG